MKVPDIFMPGRESTSITDQERVELTEYLAYLKDSISTPEKLTAAVGTSREWGWNEACELEATNADIWLIEYALENGVVFEHEGDLEL